jgi:4-alpha-glucanotransferase
VALAELASLAGVEPVVRDFFGRERAVTPEVTVALLAAMGIDASNDEAIGIAIARLRDERYAQPVPAAIVVSADAEPAFLCSAAQGTSEVFWRLEREDGGEFAGSVPWETCTLIDAAEHGETLYERRLLRLEDPLPAGYHRLLVEAAGARAEAALIAAPARSYAPDDRRRWVLAAQLYALKSARNWGIGDFTDLATLVSETGGLGAAGVALNPLHALYLTNPSAASPYAASSRRYLNALYIDIEAIPEFAECEEAQAIVRRPEFAAELAALRAAPQVPYARTAALKLRLLHVLWKWFYENHLRTDDARGRAFGEYRRREGQALVDFARYEAIAFALADGEQRHVPWQTWPADLRDPRSEAVERFARKHPKRIAEVMYRQWIAQEQLARARAESSDRGLYLDMAVGIDAGGAEVWSNRAAFAAGASLGAPPDELNEDGQDWGLLPFNPHELRRQAFRPFIEVLRASMQRAGVLRMDHVMSLLRCYWIARGFGAREGAYVRYPIDDLLGIVALESVRNKCMVVGEDLGTVPDGFRERLIGAQVLGCRLLVFERDGVRFRSPAEYTPEAVASAVTHDLPPLALWWQESDPQTRGALVDALAEAGTIEPSEAERLRVEAPVETAELLGRGVHAFLAETPCAFVAVQLEDVFGETARTNVPGTVNECPNWLIKRAINVELLASDPRMSALAQIFSSRDGRSAEATAT